jgi:pseudouridine kinase
VETGLCAALGDDPNGASLKAHCLQLGMDMSLAPVISGRNSSCYLYITDGDGDMALAINEMDICREISPEYLSSILPELEKFSAVVVDANLSEEAIAFVFENIKAPIYADPVSTVKGVKLLPHLGKLRAFKPNLLEAQMLTGETEAEAAAKKLVELGVERVFISLGAEGMLAASKDELIHLPVIPTEIVNVNGAGDSAMAAIVWADMQGMSLYDTARAARLAGSITCRSEKSNSPELGTLKDLL